MILQYILYDVISQHDVTWIALDSCSCDFCVAEGCIPTLVYCMAISLRLGWRKDHLHTAGSGDPSIPNSVISPHRSPIGCFALV